MDEKVQKIILDELSKGYVLNKNGLNALKAAIVSKTGEYKFLSHTNLKKWVNEVRKNQAKTKNLKNHGMIKGQKESKQLVSKIKKTQSSNIADDDTENIDIEILDSSSSDVIIPEPQPYEPISQTQVIQTSPLSEKLNKVQIQNILFEINSIRQTMNKISKKLDTIQDLLQKQS